MLFDMEKAAEAYELYCSQCEIEGQEPLDFDSWFDMEITNF